jgi:hypothetical protein
VVRQGVADGEFRPVNPAHFVPSMIAIIVFYFNSAPMMQKIIGHNPLTPERIAERRAAVLDFISAALFSKESSSKESRSKESSRLESARAKYDRAERNRTERNVTSRKEHAHERA